LILAPLALGRRIYEPLPLIMRYKFVAFGVKVCSGKLNSPGKYVSVCKFPESNKDILMRISSNFTVHLPATSAELFIYYPQRESCSSFDPIHILSTVENQIEPRGMHRVCVLDISFALYNAAAQKS
jgi:hypothetical protein